MKSLSTNLKSRIAEHHAKAQAAAAARGLSESGKIVSGARGVAKANDAVKGAVRPLERLAIGNVGAVSAGGLE